MDRNVPYAFNFYLLNFNKHGTSLTEIYHTPSWTINYTTPSYALFSYHFDDVWFNRLETEWLNGCIEKVLGSATRSSIVLQHNAKPGDNKKVSQKRMFLNSYLFISLYLKLQSKISPI